MVKNTSAKAGDVRDTDSVPGLGRSPGEGRDNPLQYSYLGNPIDKGAWWTAVRGVTKSLTQLESDLRCTGITKQRAAWDESEEDALSHGNDTNQSSWPSPINRNWLEAREEIPAGLYWDPCCRRREQEQQVPLFAHCWGGSELVPLHGMRVGVCPGVGLER